MDPSELPMLHGREPRLIELFSRLNAYCVDLAGDVERATTGKGHITYKAGPKLCEVLTITGTHVSVRVALHGRTAPPECHGVKHWQLGGETQPNAIFVQVADDELLDYTKHQIRLTFDHTRRPRP